MKMLYVLLSFCLMFAASTGFAGNSVNTEDFSAGTVTMQSRMSEKAMKKHDRQLLRAEKHQYKMEERSAKLMRYLSTEMAKTRDKKALGSMSDPTDKWVWYAIFAGGAAILFWIIATAISGGGSTFFWIMGTLCAIAGTAAVIYWLVLKYG